MNKACTKSGGWLFAFLFLASLIIWNMCSKKQSPNAPSEGVTYDETSAMAALSDSLILAFQSGDKERVLAFTDPEYRAVCEEELDGTQATLAAVSQALKERRLVFAGALYVEYEVMINGDHYSIAYGNCGDGHWQLLRF